MINKLLRIVYVFITVSEKHAPNSLLKRGKYKGRDIFMYIINSAAIIETSAESKKKLALRIVCHYNTTGRMVNTVY